MGPDFVVFPFDSSRMIPTVTRRLRFPDALLLFSYENSADASMGNCLLSDQVDRNRGINFLHTFAYSLIPSMICIASASVYLIA